jgi:hypothetical protein
MERIDGPEWPPPKGSADMTGSSLAPIVIPIVVAISLATWIFMVYYADSHPYWRGQATTSEQRRVGIPELPRRQTTSTQQAEGLMTRPHRMDEHKTPHAA